MCEKSTRVEYVNPASVGSEEYVFLRIDHGWQDPDVHIDQLLIEARQLAFDHDCVVYVAFKEQARNKVNAAMLVVEALKDVQVEVNVGIGSVANHDAVAALGIIVQTMDTCSMVLVEAMTHSDKIGGIWPSMLKVPNSCTDVFLLQEWLIEQKLL